MRSSRHPIASLAALATLTAAGQAVGAPRAVEAQRTAVAQAISDCRKLADKDARLDCYDKAADAFEQAQAQGQVVVIDRAQAHQIKRQAFGFNMPSLNLFKAGPKDEKLDRIEVTLADAHRSADGKWVMTTEDGAVWRQIDDTDPYDPPKAGQVMAIRTAMLGSYFCKVGTQSAMRCTRTQ
jgi:hypothetical protein